MSYIIVNAISLVQKWHKEKDERRTSFPGLIGKLLVGLLVQRHGSVFSVQYCLEYEPSFTFYIAYANSKIYK